MPALTTGQPHPLHASLTRRRFRPIAVAVAALAVVWGLAAPTTRPASDATPGFRDVDLYEAIRARVGQGDGYYTSVRTEMTSRGYALRPVFNWRLPTLAFLEGRVGNLRTTAVACLVIVLFTAVGFLSMPATTRRRLTAGLLALLTLPLVGNEQSLLLHEIPAGALIAASLAAWACGRTWLAVVLGAGALSIREHVVVYVAVMAALAAYERRGREAVAWTGVIVLFGLLYVWHASVALSLTPDDAVRNSWVVFGGWPAALTAARANAVLVVSPPWIGAIVVPVLWLGLSAWTDPIGRRLWIVVSAYLLVFMAAGRPDNWYWGFLIAPLLPLGIVGFISEPRPQAS